MRVVHLIDSGGYYGAEVMLVNLCKAQIAQGLSVEVISIGVKSDAQKPLELKLSQEKIPFKIWRMLPLPDPREAIKILRYCKSTNTQIIHSHGYKGNILTGMIPKILRGLRVVSTIHGYTKQNNNIKMKLNQWLDKRILSKLDSVVLVSSNMSHQIPAQIAKRAHIVPNGIPDLLADHSYTNVDHYFSQSDFKLGSIGRLSEEKNFSLLIDAFLIIKNQIPTAKLVIWGEGSKRKELEEKISAANMNDCISLPGYIEHPESVFKTIDVYINSSLTEGMPISLLEAMRGKTLIVATDIPANRVILEPINSLNQLCELTPESLAQTVCTLYKSEKNIKTKQQEMNRQEFIRKYTLNRMAEGYLKIYDGT